MYVLVCVVMLHMISCFINTMLTNNSSFPCDSLINPPYTWSENSFPNPWVDTGSCGRNCTKSRICDPNHIINPSEADRLDREIEAIRTLGPRVCYPCTNNNSGYSVAIALISKVKVNDEGTASEETVKAFVRDIRVRWNFQTCNNDVVIFITRDDRKVFTSVGARTEQVLNYDCLETIYEMEKSKLSEGNFAGALETMIKKYKYVFEAGNCTKYMHPERHSLETSKRITLVVVIGVMSVCVLYGCFFVLRKCSIPGGSGRGWGGLAAAWAEHGT